MTTAPVSIVGVDFIAYLLSDMFYARKGRVHREESCKQLRLQFGKGLTCFVCGSTVCWDEHEYFLWCALIYIRVCLIILLSAILGKENLSG